MQSMQVNEIVSPQVHDVIGSRCDPYTHHLLTGDHVDSCCHSNLTRQALSDGLSEADVHDVLNVFMCTGFTRDTQQYFTKPSPVEVCPALWMSDCAGNYSRGYCTVHIRLWRQVPYVNVEVSTALSSSVNYSHKVKCLLVYCIVSDSL